MKTYNIHEAKTHFSRLVDAAAGGEEVVIAKAGKPVAKLVAFAPAREPRVLGVLAGSVVEAPGCWEADSETEALFYGEAPRGPLRQVPERPFGE
jgi:prevent-host-death family protein